MTPVRGIAGRSPEAINCNMQLIKIPVLFFVSTVVQPFFKVARKLVWLALRVLYCKRYQRAIKALMRIEVPQIPCTNLNLGIANLCS